MKGEFIVMIKGNIHVFNNYDEIPNNFEHLIKFNPNIIPQPHTKEQHDEIETWNIKLKKLMDIENACSY